MNARAPNRWDRDGLGHDVALALSAWRGAPLLPIVSVVLNVVLVASAWIEHYGHGGATTWIALAGVPLLLFLAGFSGAERRWYRSQWEGRRFSFADVWNVSRQMCVPFLVFGVISVVVLLPFVALDTEFRPNAYPVYAIVGLFIEGMLGTFISPALAFQQSDAPAAMAAGIAMLKGTWPKNTAYVVFPPFAVLSIARFGLIGSFSVTLAVAAVAGLLGSLAKGATAAFYLRSAE